jgi:hypothetical protein
MLAHTDCISELPWFKLPEALKQGCWLTTAEIMSRQYLPHAWDTCQKSTLQPVFFFKFSA